MPQPKVFSVLQLSQTMRGLKKIFFNTTDVRMGLICQCYEGFKQVQLAVACSLVAMVAYIKL